MSIYSDNEFLVEYYSKTRIMPKYFHLKGQIKISLTNS